MWDFYITLQSAHQISGRDRLLEPSSSYRPLIFVSAWDSTPEHRSILLSFAAYYLVCISRRGPAFIATVPDIHPVAWQRRVSVALLNELLFATLHEQYHREIAGGSKIQDGK